MCFAAYGFTVTITMECGATVAENIPLRSPISFACQRSRTPGAQAGGIPQIFPCNADVSIFRLACKRLPTTSMQKA